MWFKKFCTLNKVLKIHKHNSVFSCVYCILKHEGKAIPERSGQALYVPEE